MTHFAQSWRRESAKSSATRMLEPRSRGASRSLHRTCAGFSSLTIARTMSPREPADAPRRSTRLWSASDTVSIGCSDYDAKPVVHEEMHGSGLPDRLRIPVVVRARCSDDGTEADLSMTSPQRSMRLTSMIERKRSREQLAQDAAFVIGSPLSAGSKYALLDNILWVWSEFDGKYDGCKWWSEQALRDRTDLRHEHAVPRRYLIERLMNLGQPTLSEVSAMLSELCVGVVVTRAEDARLTSTGLRKRMPEDWDGKDVLDRYRAAGIIPIDTRAMPGA